MWCYIEVIRGVACSARQGMRDRRRHARCSRRSEIVTLYTLPGLYLVLKKALLLWAHKTLLALTKTGKFGTIRAEYSLT
jgi:hypothetical protein